MVTGNGTVGPESAHRLHYPPPVDTVGIPQNSDTHELICSQLWYFGPPVSISSLPAVSSLFTLTAAAYILERFSIKNFCGFVIESFWKASY